MVLFVFLNLKRDTMIPELICLLQEHENLLISAIILNKYNYSDKISILSNENGVLTFKLNVIDVSENYFGVINVLKIKNISNSEIDTTVFLEVSE